MRSLALGIVSSVVIAGVGQSASADHHHKALWDHLKGGVWEYEWTGGFQEKGTARWRMAAKGKALLGRFETSDGAREVEVSGYRADKKAVVTHGFSSNGGSWHITWTDFQPKKIEGKGEGVRPDGRAFKSTFTVALSENRVEIQSKGEVEGETYEAKAVFERKE